MPAADTWTRISSLPVMAKTLVNVSDENAPQNKSAISALSDNDAGPMPFLLVSRSVYGVAQRNSSGVDSTPLELPAVDLRLST